MICFLLILLCFQSCGFIEEIQNMDVPVIVSCNPDSSYVSHEGFDTFTLNFSVEMDKNSTEEALSVLEDGTRLSGNCFWSGQSLTFHPFTEFKENKIYDFKLAKSAEDKFGNSLSEDWHHCIQTGLDTLSPELLHISHPDGSVLIHPYERISYTFSESLDKQSFRDAFSIQPELKYYLEWDNHMVTVIPIDDYSHSEEYTFLIEDSVTDPSGNPILKSHSLLLRTEKLPDLTLESLVLKRTDSELISQNILEGFEKNDILIAVFNRKPLDTESNSLIQSTPEQTANLEWVDDVRCEVYFSVYPEWGDYFDFRILEKNILIHANGTASVRPEINSIGFCPDLSSTEFHSLVLNGPFQARESESAALDILIDHSIESRINISSFLESFHMESSVLDFTILSYKEYGIHPFVKEPNLIPQEGQSLFRVLLQIQDSGLPGLVEISLNEALSDTKENYMASKWSISVQQP